MNTVSFGRLALELVGGMLAGVAAVIGFREAISIVKAGRFRLAEMSLAQFWCLVCCGALLGVLGSALDLAVRTPMYWAADVDNQFKTDKRERRKPDTVPTLRTFPYREQPVWTSDHVYWLEKEGDRDKQKGVIRAYAIAEVTNQISRPTKPFRVVLRVPDGYALWSRAAFRITVVGGAQFLQGLEIESGRDGTQELTVDAPECEDGDKLVTIVRVGTKAHTVPTDLRDVLTVRIE